MKYRGKDPRSTVTGGTSKYRGAPKAGSAGFYQGRGYQRATRPATASTASTARPVMAGGATGVPRGATGVPRGGATNNRFILREQQSQLRQKQLRDQLRYLRQQGLIDV